MTIANLGRQGDVQRRAREITCPDYDAPEGQRRCRHYLKNGACARPDHFMCEEWMRANGHDASAPAEKATSDSLRAKPGFDMAAQGGARPAPSAAAEVPQTKETVPTDLFGNPAPELVMPKGEVKAAKGEVEPPASRAAAIEGEEERPPLRGLTEEDIASFKDLNVDVCLQTERFGPIWLVPRHSGQDRLEILPEHAALLVQVMNAFPGAVITSFEKRAPEDPR